MTIVTMLIIELLYRSPVITLIVCTNWTGFGKCHGQNPDFKHNKMSWGNSILLPIFLPTHLPGLVFLQLLTLTILSFPVGSLSSPLYAPTHLFFIVRLLAQVQNAIEDFLSVTSAHAQMITLWALKVLYSPPPTL